jgi:hypothetical protein
VGEDQGGQAGRGGDGQDEADGSDEHADDFGGDELAGDDAGAGVSPWAKNSSMDKDAPA